MPNNVQIIKDTISPHLVKVAQNLKGAKKEKYMKLAMEAARSHIASYTPVVSGRLIGSLQSTSHSENVSRIEKQKKLIGSEIIGVVGTKVKYAARIEYGFVGKDSLGRSYNQKGQFYFKKGFNSAKKDIALIFTTYFLQLSS